MKSYTHFTLSERNCLQQLLSEGKSYREIGEILGRSPSTISREVERDSGKKKKHYNAWRGTTLYIVRRKKCVRKHKIQPNKELYEYIVNRLNQFSSPEIIAIRGKMLVAAIAPNREKETTRRAIFRAFALMEHPLPVETITLDNGSEFADFLNIEADLQTTIYFADPHSPWQRGLNENTNDILRFFYPKGTNFLTVSEEEFQNVIHLINSRPRKCLGNLSPLEFLSKKCCT